MPRQPRWYRKAAEQGDALAQLNLGFMYHQGKGGAAGLYRGNTLVPQGRLSG
jgi:TPR repeat protein